MRDFYVCSALHSNSSLWFKRELSEPVRPVCPPQRTNIVFHDRDKTIWWLKRHTKYFPWIYVEDETALAVAENHMYPFAQTKDGIVGYMKVAFNRVFIQDFREVIRIPADSAFIYDSFVLPSQRGKYIGAFMLSEVIRLLSLDGYERLWCHIAHWNSASLNLYRSAGFHNMARVRFIKLANMKYFNRSPETLLSGCSTNACQ